MTKLISPIGTYPLGGSSWSGIIADNRLYLGGQTKKLHVFDVTTSLNEPLRPVAVIDTEDYVSKVLRVGNQLLLGEWEGYLQVVQLGSSLITSTHQFREGGDVHDMLAIDASHFLLAAAHGLLRTTKDHVVKLYCKGKTARALCHIAESMYLVGLVNENMIVLWNEQTD